MGRRSCHHGARVPDDRQESGSSLSIGVNHARSSLCSTHVRRAGRNSVLADLYLGLRESELKLKTSQAGVKLIMEREGVRLGAYRDSRGLWTIGVGHLTDSYFPVKPGALITKQQAMDLLAHDLGLVEDVINKAAKVQLKQGQFDALASLGYNIGCGGLAHSAVMHFVNANAMGSAAAAFMNWVHPEELRARRESERRQFMGA